MVAYDHARHAPLGDVITLDFFNTDLDAGARAGVELTLETAKELRAALDRAIAAAEFEEAEVRGKGAVPEVAAAPIKGARVRAARTGLNSRGAGISGIAAPAGLAMTSQRDSVRPLLSLSADGPVDKRLLQALGIPADDYEGHFQKVLDPAEGTAFDFYMEAQSGLQVFLRCESLPKPPSKVARTMRRIGRRRSATISVICTSSSIRGGCSRRRFSPTTKC